MKQIFIDDLQTGIGKNSWCVTHSFPDRTAFIYACKCGDISTQSSLSKAFLCPRCGNGSFYFLNLVANTNNELLINLNDEPVLSRNNHFYSITYSYNKPVDFDMQNNEIIYEQQEVYELRYFHDLHKEEKELYRPTSYVTQEAERQLVSYIAYDLSKHVSGFKELSFQNISFSKQKAVVLFFMEHSNIKDAEFCLWNLPPSKILRSLQNNASPLVALHKLLSNHQSKAIKRTLFTRYQQELSQKHFDPVLPYVLCRTFKDSNYILRLLQNSTLSFADEDLGNFEQLVTLIIDLFEFLLRYYSEKQLYNIIVSSIKKQRNHRPNFYNRQSEWHDTLYMYMQFDVYIHIHFQKCSANISALHDEFVRCSRYEGSSQELNYQFSYDDSVQQASVVFEELEFRLPQTGSELNEYSLQLHNCLYSYIQKVYSRRSVIYGVFIQKTLTYAIEINLSSIYSHLELYELSTYQLIQMTGKYNKAIASPHKKIIAQWHKKYFSTQKVDL